MERNMVLRFRCYAQSVLHFPWSSGKWQTEQAVMSRAAPLVCWEDGTSAKAGCSTVAGVRNTAVMSGMHCPVHRYSDTALSVHWETKPYPGLAHAVLTSFANAQINMTIAELPCNGDALFILLSMIYFLKFVLILAWHLDLSSHSFRVLV